MAEPEQSKVSSEGIKNLWEYPFLIPGNTEEDCQHALRTLNPDVETIEKTLAALAEQITRWKAEPEDSRPTLWINGNIYKMRYLEQYRRDLEARARSACAIASGPPPFSDWPAMQKRRISVMNSRAQLVEMRDKEHRFGTLLGLLAKGYIPLKPPGNYGNPLHTELELQQFLDDIADEDQPGVVQAWYEKQAEERQRFLETEMEYGRADRELCEYAAEYLATRI